MLGTACAHCARVARAFYFIRSLRTVVALFVVSMAFLFATPASAQESGRGWRTSATGSTIYKTQSEAEAAMWALPSYASLKRIKEVKTSETQTIYIYWKGLIRPSFYNKYSSPAGGSYDTEAAAVAAWKAEEDRRSQSRGCQPELSSRQLAIGALTRRNRDGGTTSIPTLTSR